MYQILANAEAIKALYSRAQGEVSIREALHELDVWGATAVFALTDYSDCRKVVVKLIKDWKDLTNKVDVSPALDVKADAFRLAIINACYSH